MSLAFFDKYHDLLEARKTLSKAATVAAETEATLAFLEPTYQDAKSKHHQAAQALKMANARTQLLGNQHLWSLLCGPRMKSDTWSHIWSFYSFNHGPGIKYSSQVYSEEDRMKHYTTEVRLRSLCKAFHCSIPAPSILFVGVPGPWNYQRIDQAVDVVKWLRRKGGDDMCQEIRVGQGDFEIRNLIEDIEASRGSTGYVDLGNQDEECLGERCTLLDYPNLKIVGSGTQKTMVYGGFHARGPLAKNITLENMTITNPCRGGKGINLSMGASGIIVNACEIVECSVGVRVYVYFSSDDENTTSKNNPELALEMTNCHIHHNRTGLALETCDESTHMNIRLMNCEIAYHLHALKMLCHNGIDESNFVATIDMYEMTEIHANVNVFGPNNSSFNSSVSLAVRVFSPPTHQTFRENLHSCTDRIYTQERTSGLVVKQMVLPSCSLALASQAASMEQRKLWKRKLCQKKRFAVVPDDFLTVDEAVKEARMSAGQIIEIRVGHGTHFVGSYVGSSCCSGGNLNVYGTTRWKSELVLDFSNLTIIGAGCEKTVLVGRMVIKNAIGIAIKNLSVTSWFGGYLIQKEKILVFKWATGDYVDDELNFFVERPDESHFCTNECGYSLNSNCTFSHFIDPPFMSDMKQDGCPHGNAALTVTSGSSVAADNIIVLASGSKRHQRMLYFSAVLVDDECSNQKTVLTMNRSHIHHCLSQGVLVTGKCAEATLIDCEVDHVIKYFSEYMYGVGGSGNFNPSKKNRSESWLQFSSKW